MARSPAAVEDGGTAGPIRELAAPLLKDAPCIHASPHQSASAVEIIDTLEGLRALEPEWRELEDQVARSTHLFQSYDWCSAWAEHYVGGASCHSLFIVTVRQDGCIRLIWPLMRTCAGPVCVLRWLTDPWGQYGDVLCGDEPGTEAWLHAAWAAIRTSPGVHAVRLRHVREDAIVCSFLRERFRAAGEPDGAPFMDLSAFADEAAYEKRYTKVQRRRRKRIRAELEREGPLSFEATSQAAELDAVIDDALARKRQWLARRGLHSDVVRSKDAAGFLQALSRRSQRLRLVASLGAIASRPISMEIGLRYRGSHFAYITAHDGNLSDHSPARLHMDLAQRQALADGMNAFDLMVPAAPHKRSYSSDVVRVFDFHAPVSARGWAYGYAYLEKARPWIRKRYHAVPARLRRGFTRLAKPLLARADEA